MVVRAVTVAADMSGSTILPPKSHTLLNVPTIFGSIINDSALVTAGTMIDESRALPIEA